MSKHVQNRFILPAINKKLKDDSEDKVVSNLINTLIKLISGNL